MPLHRRRFLQAALLAPTISIEGFSLIKLPRFLQPNGFKRVRPTDKAWPSSKQWQKLNLQVNGNLIKLQSPLTTCKTAGDCDKVFSNLKNPYYIGDNPALTQTTGWIDAWNSQPSVYAVAAKTTNDVVAAVNFARQHNLRVVVKGGGHSYQGTSSAPDSLLIWTRAMHSIELSENFVGYKCNKQDARQAVTIGAGAMWMQAYNAVTTKAGKYVQGGGCATVGVAGLIQSGGFGSFSKKYGLAAAALLEAEIVLADGSVKIANACNEPELFWALKGGGGGSIGVVTKLTLRTRELPSNFGGAFCSIKASNDESYKLLIKEFMKHYQRNLFNEHWGESVQFFYNKIEVKMVFQGVNQEQAKEKWSVFENWVKQSGDYTYDTPVTIIEIPSKHMWDPAFLQKYAPGFTKKDQQAGAPDDRIYWAGDGNEAGQFLYAYHSAWLPADLLQENKIQLLSDMIFAASRHWTISLHFNKGLAGAPPQEIEAAKNTAMNPAVTEAFALAIIAGQGEPADPGVPGREPDTTEARKNASHINKAFNELLKLVPEPGSYVSESSFFLKNWQQAFWGNNYPRLLKVKKKYDPDGLFFVHHGVGSEGWSADGFTRLQ